MSGLIGVDGWFELSSQAPSRARSIGIAIDKGTLFFPSRVAIEHSIHQKIWPPLTGMVTDELQVLRNDVTATRLSSYVTRALLLLGEERSSRVLEVHFMLRTWLIKITFQ